MEHTVNTLQQALYRLEEVSTRLKSESKLITAEADFDQWEKLDRMIRDNERLIALTEQLGFDLMDYQVDYK